MCAPHIAPLRPPRSELIVARKPRSQIKPAVWGDGLERAVAERPKTAPGAAEGERRWGRGTKPLQPANGGLAPRGTSGKINSALSALAGLIALLPGALKAHPETEGERRWGSGGRGLLRAGSGIAPPGTREGEVGPLPRNTPRPLGNHDLRLRHRVAAAQRRRLLTLGLTRTAGT
jgi:hypothetical protein